MWVGCSSAGRRSPFFIFPVRRGEGKFFNLISQFQPPHCIFTFMEDFQRNPQLAEPYFAMTFFEDFKDSKGLVLVRGDFSGHINKADATRLLQLTKHFYIDQPKLVETFNQRPAEFDFTRLLAECP